MGAMYIQSVPSLVLYLDFNNKSYNYIFFYLTSFSLTWFGVANPGMILGGVIKRWVGLRAGDIKLRRCVTRANENQSPARKPPPERCV